MICLYVWKRKNKKPIVFKIDFISKYRILKRRESNFINKMNHENGITTICRIFPCTRHLNNLHILSFPHCKQF